MAPASSCRCSTGRNSVLAALCVEALNQCCEWRVFCAESNRLAGVLHVQAFQLLPEGCFQYPQVLRSSLLCAYSAHTLGSHLPQAVWYCRIGGCTGQVLRSSLALTLSHTMLSRCGCARKAIPSFAC